MHGNYCLYFAEEDYIAIYDKTGKRLAQFYIYIDVERLGHRRARREDGRNAPLWGYSPNIVLYYSDGDRFDHYLPTLMEFIVNKWKPGAIRAWKV